MKKNKILKLIMLGIISFLPMNTLALTKNESVYTTLNLDGTKSSTTITNHLFVNNEKEIEDESELSKIFNINGKETFTKNNNSLKWKVNGKDIFYEGTTNKDLPIDVKIKYYLNNKEQNVKDMINKKGNIKIVITLKNNLKNIVNINGSKEEIYTPFVVMAGTIFDGKENNHIEVTNGKVVNTGSKNAVVSIASPGLYESLNVNEFNNMNDIVIEYKTKKFSLNNIYIIATPKLIEKEDIEIFNEVDNLSDNIKTLQTSINTIETGAKKLENGSDSLLNGVNEIQGSLNTVISSISSLQNGTGNLKNGINSAIEGLNNAENVINSFNLANIGTTLNNIKNSNDVSITRLLTASGMDFQTLSAYVNNSSNASNSDYAEKTSILNAIVSLKTSNQAFDEVMNNLNSISGIIPKISELKSGLIALNNGSIQIYNGLGSLRTGVEKIYAGQTKLTNGVKELNSGVNELSSGITTFNKEGISVLSNYSSKLNSYNNKVEALVDLSKNYKGFTSNNSTNTIFINKVKSLD